MKSRPMSGAIMVLTAALLLIARMGLAADTNPASDSTGLAAQEKAACTKNLKVINDAIQAYKIDNKVLPNWLSDLVPQYLNDANVLVCPVCLRTGNLEMPETADPKLATSYDYQFCPVPLGKSAPNSPDKTRREWKLKQVALVGPLVPLVRCRHHNLVLNLGCDGRIYESGVEWETLITNGLRAADLRPSQVFAEKAPAPPSPKPSLKKSAKTSASNSKAKSGPVILSKFFNAGLADPGLGGGAGDDLATLPMEKNKFAGIDFDIKNGIVQLAGKPSADPKFTNTVRNIHVRRICRTLNFLHGAAFGTGQDEGRRIGSYVVYYATNQMRLEIPIDYGKDVRDWHVSPDEPRAPRELTVGWSGQNAAGKSVRLFVTTWTNLVPDVEIEKIDFKSNLAGPSPFLVGFSTE